MASQKYEPMLNLALDVTEGEREQSGALSAGYQALENTWDVIIRYAGDIEFLRKDGVQIQYLEGQYAILTVPDAFIRRLSEFPEIIYVEIPKSLYLTVVNGIRASCINPVQVKSFPGGSLTGEGVICACIDSGIDIYSPVFRNSDGTTRILELWDQTLEGNPPEGFRMGSVYKEEDINILLKQESSGRANTQAPGRDVSGHGTHVAGIMAGNFAENRENNVGIATKSPLVIVKLNTATNNGFPRTTELMQAISYVYRTALKYQMPVSINISFGNSYGSHDGTSLLETFIDDVSNLWKMSISIGTGNEGSSAGHAMEIFSNGENKRIEFTVGNYERNLNIQIWKTYEDEFQFIIYSPGGVNSVTIPNVPGTLKTRIGNNRILVYYGEPSPYSRFQEIYIEILPYYAGDNYISTGIWGFYVSAGNVISGRLDFWLPDSAILNENTRFENPEPDTTLTIPSTSASAISVGGYN
ncbi:MAG: S8 family serine peptidase, partial [Lachnospiraceae bacterium]|nr:S8 family serine peptidase [Lachnospiraceae bacterium]